MEVSGEQLGNQISTGTSAATVAGGAGARRRRATVELPTWRETLGIGGFIQVAILAALFIWLYKAQCYRLIRMWQNPDWSHGFLIPFFCIYMLNTRKAELLTGSHKGSLWGLPVIILGILAYAYFIRIKFGYPQDLSMLMVLGGLVLLMCGWRVLRYCLFPIGFLLLAIPPPDYVYKSITQPLQQMAAWISTKFLNMFPGAEVEQAGINIAYYMRGGNSGAFTVAGACSGMRSLLAFVALGLAMAYFTPRPTWHRVAMALFVVPVALLCNVLRVIATGAFQMYDYGNLASGTPHTLLGLIMFATGFAIYGGILWALDNLFVEETDDSARSAPTGGAAA